MNTLNPSKHDRYGRGVLAKPATRYANIPVPHPHQRNLLNNNRYVPSGGLETIPDQDYYGHQAYESSFEYPYGGRLPLDERMEDLKSRALLSSRYPATRTPGYVTSFDNTPSRALPHASLTSGDPYDPSTMLYDGSRIGGYGDMYPSAAYFEDPYSGDWSSDGSSEVSQGPGRHVRHRHRPQAGQTRMTDLGREIFNGVAWVTEDDYLENPEGALSRGPVGYATHFPNRY